MPAREWTEMTPSALRGPILALAIAALPLAAAHGAIKQIDKSGKWTAHLLTEKNKRICFVHSEPTKKVGQYTRRGDVFVQITHRPHANVTNEVGFTAGYAFKKDSNAVVEVDGRKFSLFTHKDGAWANDNKGDDALVQAMMKGRQLLIRGTSSRGTKTIDTYSLIGFTRTYKAIGKACKVR
jgi:hypothetical protein